MPGKSIFYKSSLLFVIVAGLSLFFYTNYRAATLSITHDEGIIYRVITGHSCLQIFNYVIPQDHMLNSLLMKFSSILLPHNEYTLRLPNLLGHLLYIIFSILLLLRLKNPHLLIAGFVLLNFNPYLLDFFSIARGYGLSVSFMMVSLYYAFTFIQSAKIRPLFISFIFAILAVLSVYTLLNYFIALCGIVVLMMIIWWINGRNRLNRKFIQLSGIYLLILAASITLLYLQLKGPLDLIQSKQFIYQTFHANLYSDTIRPIVFRSIYNSDPKTTVDIASYGIIAVYILIMIKMIVMAIRRDFSFTGRLMFLSFVVIIIAALSILAQHELFNIRLLSNRTATFIIPLIILSLIGLTEELIRRKGLKIPSLIFIYILSALFIYNTVKNANFEWYLEWKNDASTRDMMRDLCEDAATNPVKEVKLGIVWFHEPSINFYRKTWHLDWLKEVDKNGYIGDFDYFYVDNADSVLSKDIFRDKIIINRYGKSKTVLLKKTIKDEADSQ